MVTQSHSSGGVAPPSTPSIDAAALRIWWQRHGVPRDYARARGLTRIREPRALRPIGLDIHGRAQWLAPAAARGFARMRDAASVAGIALEPVSAFRSIAYQCGIFERKLARGDAIASILEVNAAPGFSEHHSGRALDLTTPGFPALEEAFETAPAFAWLAEHAAHFGFALSYPRDNPHGIAYEPWHWCWQARRGPQASAGSPAMPHR